MLPQWPTGLWLTRVQWPGLPLWWEGTFRTSTCSRYRNNPRWSSKMRITHFWGNSRRCCRKWQVTKPCNTSTPTSGSTWTKYLFAEIRNKSPSIPKWFFTAQPNWKGQTWGTSLCRPSSSKSKSWKSTAWSTVKASLLTVTYRESTSLFSSFLLAIMEIMLTLLGIPGK